MTTRRRLRGLFVVLLVTAGVAVGHGLATAAATTSLDRHLEDRSPGDDDVVAPPADGATVIATDSNVWRAGGSDDPRANAQLVAIDSDGTILYVDDSHDRYWDVDPVEGTTATVEYVYSDHLAGEECPMGWEPDHGVDEATWEAYAAARDRDACTRNGVERVDLRTGEVTAVWSHVTPGKAATRYHDVDRLDDERIVVADIYLDRVFVVHVPTDEVEWTWNASDRFSTEVAGPYPKDWTHLNDVEVLEDGRIMVSLRNLDQAVFLDRSGVIEDWTLGVDNDYETLYEQHNPDYIPAESGGPAVVVPDSENNRLVEYQRSDGEWHRTWQWRDDRLQWPRDADRLPNGHTLVADSNGNRVFEIDDDGAVVWSVDVAFPYEAERLSTGDESADGPSASHADLQSRSIGAGVLISLKGWLPGKYLNGVLYATPVWMGLVELLALVGGLLVGLVWAGLELRWGLKTGRGSVIRLVRP